MDSLITSTKNPKVKHAAKLMRRPHRDKMGLFLIEGYRELMRAVEGGEKIEQVFASPPLFLGTNEESLLARCHAEIVFCDEKVFRSLSYRDRPDGLLAVAKKRARGLDALPKRECPLYIVAEAIEKPGNLGTILRSADAAGVDGVIVCDRCTDLHNPNVVRASVGTLFTVPVVEATGEQTLAFLQAQNIPLIAATPAATQIYTDVDLSGPVAIAVGTEQYGLSAKWMDGATLQVRIPMLGRADSLNVAMATTLLLYEARRQREAHRLHQPSPCAR